MDNNQFNQYDQTKQSGSKVGPIIGSVIIIVLIILGGLYYWGYVINKQSPSVKGASVNMATSTKSTQISDPDLAKINSELNSSSTNAGSIDQDMNQLDAEIDAAVK